MAPPKPDNGFAANHFPGTAPEGVVLIVAGLHTSEQSGVEVANWIRVKLAELPKPSRLSAIVIPEMFPAFGEQARKKEWLHPGDQWDNYSDDFREYPMRTLTIHPNRQFPPPGQPLDYLVDKSGRGTLKKFDGSPVLENGSSIPLLPQIRQLIELIELHKPISIVSIHGIHRAGPQPKKRVNFAGVFVDPRYAISPADLAEIMKNEAQDVYGLEKYKFDLDADPAYEVKTNPDGSVVPKRFNSAWSPDGQKDDQLALDLATEVARLAGGYRTLVWGNHLNETDTQVVHYARQKNTPPGYSLGDWGPVLDWGPAKSGVRPGAPVFTIEPDMDFESWAFLDGVQYVDKDGNKKTQYQRNPQGLMPAKFRRDRSEQLQAYAQAVINICLK